MHGISIEEGKGRAIFAGERKSVWHRLGEYFGSKLITIPDLRKCVGIPVEKVEVTYNKPVANGTDTVPTVSKKAFLTVRMDTGAELCSVGPDYNVIQHDTALVEAIEPIIDAGYATIDAAGLLFGGAKAWSLLKWNLERFDPIVRDVYKQELQVYGLCVASHERRANIYANVTERGVCQNTISIGLATGTLKTRVVHRGKAAPRRQLEAAQQTFKHVIAHHVSMAEKYRALQGLHLDLAMWKELVQKVAVPDPREDPTFDPKSPRADLVVERFRTKANRIYKLMVSGTGQNGEKTAWAAYNGLIESMDHDTDLWKARSDENRALSLTDGPMAKIRETVFDNLVAAASR